ncbi:hypothetical protein LH29_01155 [Draconibacterium sediminis]|uniref:DUF6443 domain-containing protein n=2 Tax=Draconibacterium sediminis TaxID=1544798 RepID=A0A0D8JAZ0_9BACT|nr:hypothetical protein LH29_01155 [Draconibacterium sediminis]
MTSVLLGFVCQFAHAQYLEDSNIYDIPDSLEIVHCKEVRLTPGFWAKSGSDIHVYTDSTLICFDPEEGEIAQEINFDALKGHNYVYTVVMREAETDESSLGSRERIETIDYFDGLGRPLQSITIQGSPLNKDIIRPVEYDEFGREKYKYLPYVAENNTGAYAENATTASTNFYGSEIPGKESDTSPFAEILFDGSPLNRVTGEHGVGENFHAHPTNIKYLTNTQAIKNWSVSGNPAVFSSNDFLEHQLYLTEFTDEEGNKTREYKDKLGRVVCKAARDDGTWLNTHYIYDDFGLLRCVVPPKATGPSDSELCYYYQYDYRKRMIVKDLPGAEPVYMVYDARDRLVMVQDGNNRSAKKPIWQFTEYDNFNRPIRTGLVESLHTHDKVIEKFKEVVQFAAAKYSVTEILTETRYDDYESGLAIAYQFSNYNDGGLPVEKSDSTNGLVTQTINHVLQNDDDNIASTTLKSVIYYDRYARASRIISDNHFGGIDVVDNSYNFAGEIVETLLRHDDGIGDSIIAILTQYDYDHQGRIISETVQINNQKPIIVAAYDYNELGEQIGKYLHGNPSSSVFNQKVDYTYNIKGWLRQINEGNLDNDNDLFALDLEYATGGYFNGNIAKMSWQNEGEELKGYSFSYDNLNRLLTANYGETADLNTNTGLYNTAYDYDANGNMLWLNRIKNGAPIDELVYDYGTGNQLITVNEQVPNDTAGYLAGALAYDYDANGNMVFDPSKNSAVTYNRLNLPQKVVFENNDNLRYIYNAGGTKLRKAIADEFGNVNKHFDYIGPFIYENNELKAIFTSAGRAVPISQNGEVLYQFEYNLQDHLGNTRVVFSGNSNGRPEVLQLSEYYPFGMIMNQQNSFADGILANKYLYNGKELQDDDIGGSKLDWYDYGARFYDPSLGRFHSVDPLTEDYYSWTPYHYVHNNPILLIDPTGMGADWFENELTGDVYYNSSMKKGDEGTGAMKGDGWKHMGENGMFGTDDNTVIEANKSLATDFKTTGKEFTTEASFRGENAKGFMKGQGYEFKPTQQIQYEANSWIGIPLQGRPSLTINIGLDIYITEKSSYISQKAVETSTIPISKTISGRDKIFLETVNRFQISYSNDRTSIAISRFNSHMEKGLGNRNSKGRIIYNSSKQYTGNNKLINEFMEGNIR